MTMNASESYTPDRLLAGGCLVTDQVTLVSGAGALKRGTLLGKITASGKYTTCDSAGTDDGRRTPVCILAVDADATSADVVAPVYLAGEFNSNAMTFGGTDTATTHKATLRDLNIYLKDPVKA